MKLIKSNLSPASLGKREQPREELMMHDLSGCHEFTPQARLHPDYVAAQLVPARTFNFHMAFVKTILQK